MFREASAIDSERTAATVRSLYAKYTADENWFTGTPDSVDRRIAQAKKIANAAKAACVRLSGRNVVSQYIALAHEMDSDRRALEGLRRDLLTAATDRDDYEDHRRSKHREAIKWPEPINEKGELIMDGPKMMLPVLEESDRWDEDGKHYYSEPKTSMRSEARHFVASQECDDLRELTIRAKHYAERISSAQPPRQSAAFVRSFVEAVRDAYEPPRQRRTAATHSIQNYPSELMYFDDIE